MCACPQVMHGLVIPLGAVSGIEDVDRPAAIWKFAWDVSQNAGFAPEQTALVVNSPNHRSQSQLHVHILPLDSRKSGDLESTPFEEAPDLYSVWTRADALAASNSLRTFGVLVHGKGQVWHIHVADVPLNETFTTLTDCERVKNKKKR
jgi:diadenosine tetraphosphate (Ap4A) HIT family hydrolase